MKAFIGVRMAIERDYRGAYSELWSARFQLNRFPGIAEIFPRNRFYQLLRYIHYCDEEQATPYDNPDHDKLFKVRSIVNHLKTTFRREYSLHRETSVDECMIPMKGRLSWKQYTPMKPIKWGMKVFMLADSHTGYCYNIEPYVGAEEIGDYINIGLATRIVLQLCHPIIDRGHHVFTDRFFTSPLLLRYLWDLGTLGCGTVQQNRKNFPDLNDLALDRGMSRTMKCSNTGMVATKWMDRRAIYFLSTAHQVESPMDLTIGRRDARGRAVQIPCTLSVIGYNNWMGGVDRNDQLARMDKQRRTMHWPQKFERKAHLWCLVNAHIIYKDHHRQQTPEMSFQDFTMEVAEQMVGTYCGRGYRQQHLGLNMDGRLVASATMKHHPVQTSNQTSFCKVCKVRNQRWRDSDKEGEEPKRRRSGITCSSLHCRGVYLCVRKGSSCWSAWHEKKEFWR